MRRVMLGVAFILVVQNASAAVEYEFRQVTHSDLENVQATDFTGRALIDGDKSRVEFLTGTGYPPGTYLISTNGSRTMTFVDPGKKTYLEVNAGSVSAALGAMKIAITNKKIDLTQMDDHPIIAGLPTDHYRLSLAYDITLSVGTLDLTQNVHTVEDKWVTGAFGGVAENYISAGAWRTGNPELDDLIETENTKVKGFTLKQVISTTTMNNGHQVPGSPLKVARTVTSTSEITVTSIAPKASVPAAVFLVPVGFKKTDATKDDTQKTPLHVLSMEPPSGQ